MNSFDLNLAIFLARMSELAYGSPSVVPGIDGRSWHVQNFDRGNIQGFSAADPEGRIVLLAFRGTGDLGQIVRDARVSKAQHPWGRVHVGFRDGLSNVEEEMQLFNQLAKSAEQVLMTGHSLGGALALLAAVRLKMVLQKNPLVYTFGQPRVGDQTFASRFDVELPGCLVRTINQSDIVPNVPPEFLGFRHSGQPKRIVASGVLQSRRLESVSSLELDDGDPEEMNEEEFALLEHSVSDNPAALSVEGPQLEGRAIPWLANHGIAEYVRELEVILEQHPGERS